MALEFAQFGVNTDECYPFDVTPVTSDDGASKRIIEWNSMILALLADNDIPTISAKFHNTLAAMIVTIAEDVGEPVVVLTGGCFQNRALLEKSILRLRSAGFTPYWQQQIPPNDGGIALGQIMGVIRNVSSRTGKTDQHHR
jgi:hydrogenase maturation protein HypF